MNISKFIIYTFLGSLLWSGVLAYIEVYLGAKWNTIGPIFSKFNLVIICILVVLVIYFVYHKLRKST